MKIQSRKFLPSNTPSVHASTIEWWNDHFVYSWFGGSQEGQSDVSIYLYNLNNRGETIVLGNNDGMPRWNPILYQYGGRLYLFEKAGMFCDRWQTIIHDITEWDEKTNIPDIMKNAQVLPAGLNGPVKLRPVNFEEYIFCGSSVETFFDWTSYIERYRIINNRWIFVDRSNPLNVLEKKIYTDKFSGVKKRSLGIIQPSLWIEDNKVKAFFRSSYGLGSIFYSENITKNQWTEPESINIPNNNSGVSTVFYNKNLYLAFNNNDTHRYPLEVRGLDNNLDLTNDFVIVGDRDNNNIYEYSYPYMIENDGKLELVYTYGRKKIEHVTISLEEK